MSEHRGMKDGESCWMIERKIDGSPHWMCWELDESTANYPGWTTDPNKALHFADQQSCDQMCAEMPDEWDVKITDHAWMDKSDPWKELEPLEDQAGAAGFVGGLAIKMGFPVRPEP